MYNNFKLLLLIHVLAHSNYYYFYLPWLATTPFLAKVWLLSYATRFERIIIIIITIILSLEHHQRTGTGHDNVIMLFVSALQGSDKHTMQLHVPSSP